MTGIETKNYKAGEVIYNINDPADKIYLIHNGKVRVKSKMGLNLGVLIEGEMFGEVGPIIEETRTVTVIAETNCTLKEIDDATIHNKLDGADPVLVGIIRGLALRIGDANKLAEKYWQELSVYKSLE
ncbi:MAG: cyclic nucleotide-binding domain-containing protein [Candidatus Puniceispirillales bacterium]|jgi:CRP-like cAMP-binding protein|tara:strand:+ start:1968 stop:2348 length:381 start_codon:yes stop_codon:yes gene_type:complete